MKHLLRILPLLFVALLFLAGCTDTEDDAQEVPFDQMDRDTVEVTPDRAFEDSIVVDTTEADTARVDTMPEM